MDVSALTEQRQCCICAKTGAREIVGRAREDMLEVWRSMRTHPKTAIVITCSWSRRRGARTTERKLGIRKG